MRVDDVDLGEIGDVGDVEGDAADGFGGGEEEVGDLVDEDAELVYCWLVVIWK